MMELESFLEISRWGYVQIPVMLYCYTTELDLELEDLAILGAVFNAYQNRSKPLYKAGVEISQVMQSCPAITKSKLARKLAKWEKTGIIAMEGTNQTEFTGRKIFLEPLYRRLQEFIIRDHPEFSEQKMLLNMDTIQEYERKIEELEKALYQERVANTLGAGNQHRGSASAEYKKIADFISQRTGNLISVKMANEIHKWINNLGFKTEFLLCMLELCFERKIYHPRDISKIASGLKECSINSLETMETYFRTFVDNEKWQAVSSFDPEVTEFGNYIGIDMNAEARKKLYYKWRYDWGFSKEIIKRAGEIMCARTKSGGLEYIDGILSNWKEKGLLSLNKVEEEHEQFKAQRKNKSSTHNMSKKPEEKREIYIPPAMLNLSENE